MSEAPKDISLNPALIQQAKAYGLPVGPERDTAIDGSNRELLDVLRLGQIAVEPLAIDQSLDPDNHLASQLAAVNMVHLARSNYNRNAAHSAGQLLNIVNEQLISILQGTASTKSTTKHPDEK